METYYDPADLANFSTMGEEVPEMWENFLGYYGPATSEGALSAREKSLIALGVAAALQCPYCIHAYTDSCLSKGIDEEEMTEVFHVAAALRAGATLVHGVQMKNMIKRAEA